MRIPLIAAFRSSFPDLLEGLPAPFQRRNNRVGKL
jgi:hypothetical protein